MIFAPICLLVCFHLSRFNVLPQTLMDPDGVDKCSCFHLSTYFYNDFLRELHIFESLDLIFYHYYNVVLRLEARKRRTDYQGQSFLLLTDLGLSNPIEVPKAGSYHNSLLSLSPQGSVIAIEMSISFCSVLICLGVVN